MYWDIWGIFWITLIYLSYAIIGQKYHVYIYIIYLLVYLTGTFMRHIKNSKKRSSGGH